jgi:undecaprenyl-diphosphatase
MDSAIILYKYILVYEVPMFPIIQQFDDTLLYFIAEHLHTPFVDRLMIFITSLGNSSLVWLSTALILVLSQKNRKWGIILTLALIFELLLCDGILKPLVARERPFTRLTGYPELIRAPLSYSFPSGHTMSSFTAAVILFARERKSGSIFLILAALIGFSRLYLFVHYPTDVLGGIVLGIALALMTLWLTKDLKA